jgi:hypothetical protein
MVPVGCAMSVIALESVTVMSGTGSPTLSTVTSDELGFVLVGGVLALPQPVTTIVTAKALSKTVLA